MHGYFLDLDSQMYLVLLIYGTVHVYCVCILETYICEYLICISRLSSVSFRLLCAYVYLCEIADLGHCYLVRFYDYIVTYICILKATRLSYSLTESFTVLCVSCKLVNYLAAAIDRFLCVQL